jgi:hypothetical protein
VDFRCFFRGGALRSFLTLNQIFARIEKEKAFDLNQKIEVQSNRAFPLLETKKAVQTAFIFVNNC